MHLFGLRFQITRLLDLRSGLGLCMAQAEKSEIKKLPKPLECRYHVSTYCRSGCDFRGLLIRQLKQTAIDCDPGPVSRELQLAKY
jgi:hypothetical protein